MAKGKKTGGRDFVPGHSVGRPRVPPEIKAVRRLTKSEFERIANKFLFASQAELTAVSANPEAPAFERLLVSIMLAAINDGDHAKAEWFAMRLLGKVQDKLEVSQPKPFIIERLDGTQTVLGAAIEPEKD